MFSLTLLLCSEGVGGGGVGEELIEVTLRLLIEIDPLGLKSMCKEMLK